MTQVVPPEEEFHYHDRLSHSIKVAQVSATLARMLVYRANEGGRECFAEINLEEWVDPDHCYAAGLAHDIGHPPFGHAGEAALQQILELMGEKDEQFWDLDSQAAIELTNSDSSRLAERSFEGNAQSTRVVSKLSFRGDGLNAGLNLTLRTMAAIAKYPWAKGGHPVGQNKLAQKWSFYPEEVGILDKLVRAGFVQPVTDKNGAVIRVHRWVEAEIMDWADDISYAVHDLDDFYRARLIPLGQILLEIQRTRPTINWFESSFDFGHDADIGEALQYISAKLKSFQERSQASFNDPAQTPGRAGGRMEEFNAAFEQIRSLAQEFTRSSDFSGTHEAHADLRRFSSAVIKYLSEAASLGFDAETQRVQLRLDPTAVLVAEFFKAINSYFVIESINLAAMQYGQQFNLYSLFSGLHDLTAEWMEKQAENKKSNRLPARLRSYLTTQAAPGQATIPVAENPTSTEDVADAPGEDLIAIAVLDYITSLRDAQAAHLAAQLRGARETPTVAGNWLNT
ncbi:dGTPase [Brachybacterium aquaticum]|uniref:dGTPase n=1 Tax=Brachybacterium aquaticum TaxID=1432564 RepID=A0A841AD65_9MICO|nr:dGTPase [Brachybacterium aquaticum]